MNIDNQQATLDLIVHVVERNKLEQFILVRGRDELGLCRCVEGG